MERIRDDGLDAWRSHPRVRRHFCKFRDHPDRAGVLSRYARAVESGEWSGAQLQRHTFHAAAWVALLPLAVVFEAPAGAGGFSPAVLLAHLLRLLRDVKPSAWLRGMLLVVAARLAEVALDVPREDFGPWASLRDALGEITLADQGSRPTGGRPVSMEQRSGEEHRPKRKANKLVFDQVNRPPRWWMNVGSSVSQSTDAQEGDSNPEFVETVKFSDDVPVHGVQVDATASSRILHACCSQKAVRLFLRAHTSWHNETSWTWQQSYLEGLTMQFGEACKQENQLALCRVLRKAVAALSPPRRLQVDVGALHPLDDLARQRLQRAFQTKLRAVILQCLILLDHSLDSSLPALLHMQALILQYEHSAEADISSARGGKQWQLLKSAVGSAVSFASNELPSVALDQCTQSAIKHDEKGGYEGVSLQSSNTTASVGDTDLVPSTRVSTSTTSQRSTDIDVRAPRSRRLCPHGMVIENCRECLACPHGKLKRNCTQCTQCEHGKLKYICGLCKACPHGKLKQNCRTCNGCPHGKLKRNCVICLGSCEHGKVKRDCAKCIGCPHGVLKRHCATCVGCPHGKMKPDCWVCGACAHGKVKRYCIQCSACPHGRLKRDCRQCSACSHGKLRRSCTLCRHTKMNEPVPVHKLG